MKIKILFQSILINLLNLTTLFGVENKSLNLDSSDFFSNFIRIISVLCIVLICILLGSYFLNHFLLRKSKIIRKKRVLRLIDSLYVGSKSSIAVIEIKEKYLVVGITPTNISPLITIDSLKQNEYSSNIEKQSVLSKTLSNLINLEEKLINLKKENSE